jgi:hypothetical protein
MAEVPPFTMPYPTWLGMTMLTTRLLEAAKREDTKRPWSLEGILLQLIPEGYVAVIPENVRSLVITYMRNVGEEAPTLADVETLHRGLRQACLEWFAEHQVQQA